MNSHSPSTGSRASRRTGLGLGVATAALLALAPGAHAAAAKIYVGTPGADRLTAKSSSGNILWGGGGADTLIGGKGPDFIYGIRSNNKILGNGGDDYIEGGAGSDSISGGAGNNTIFGSSGHDVITAGDGNNYIDTGGAPDTLTVGNGNNVIHTGSGGIKLKVGNGTNTIYYGSGISTIEVGSGVNTIYLAGTAGLKKLDCGGNPNTVVYANESSLNQYSLQILRRDKTKGCATITTYDGSKRINAKQPSSIWDSFRLIGSDGRDKLFGNHGGGYIEGKEGDDEIWGDRLEDTGGARAKATTVEINAGGGNNRIFGGRGTNVITAGNGNNFVRAGAHINRISLGSGQNLIRLQGATSTNTVTLNGRGAEPSYIESLANGKKPVIRCNNGAKAIIVFGNTKPKSNCKPSYSARSPRGKELQVLHTPGVPASDDIVEVPIRPGEQGIGVPRPAASQE